MIVITVVRQQSERTVDGFHTHTLEKQSFNINLLYLYYLYYFSPVLCQCSLTKSL